MFHYVLTKAADEYAGFVKRGTRNYALVYRSIDHRTLRELCLEAAKQTPSARYQRHLPVTGLGPRIRAFGIALVELQEKRHAADYDPAIRVKTSDAKLAIGTALSAMARFDRAGAEEQKAFLTLLLFPPR